MSGYRCYGHGNASVGCALLKLLVLGTLGRGNLDFGRGKLTGRLFGGEK